MLAQIVWDQYTLGTVLGLAVPLVAIIGGIYYAISKVRSDNDLKREMVARGMSVEEIERVMAAKSK